MLPPPPANTLGADHHEQAYSEQLGLVVDGGSFRCAVVGLVMVLVRQGQGSCDLNPA